jgi:hypothetical protein
VRAKQEGETHAGQDAGQGERQDALGTRPHGGSLHLPLRYETPPDQPGDQQVPRPGEALRVPAEQPPRRPAPRRAAVVAVQVAMPGMLTSPAAETVNTSCPPTVMPARRAHRRDR